MTHESHSCSMTNFLQNYLQQKKMSTESFLYLEFKVYFLLLSLLLSNTHFCFIRFTLLFYLLIYLFIYLLGVCACVIVIVINKQSVGLQEGCAEKPLLKDHIKLPDTFVIKYKKG